MSDMRLVFDGDIDFTSGLFEDDGYKLEVVEGTQFGNAVPVEVVLSSLLKDGTIVATSGYDNREATVLVRIVGQDSQALALGHKRLALATGKRSTLAYTPPDGFGPTTVFKVLTSSLARPEFDDLAELRNTRTYELRLVCEPFARSVDLVTDDAGTPPSGGGTLLYGCESTDGWERIGFSYLTPEYVVDSTVFSEGTGSIRSLATFHQTGYYSYSDGWNVASSSHDGVSGLSLSTDTGGYLSLRTRFEWIQMALAIYVTTAEGGRERVTAPLSVQLDAAGFTHYVWPVEGGLTITGFDIQWGQRGPSLVDNKGHFWTDALELLPAATTDHQIVKRLEVEGSARTTGALHVAAPTDVVALGHVLAITAPTSELPAGFLPDARRWVTQGTTTADTSTHEDSYFTPAATYSSDTGKPIFDVPAGMLTAGPYTMVALVKAETSTLTTGVQAQLLVDGTLVGPTSAAEVSPTGLTTGWQFVTVGTVNLPPLPVQGADETVKVRLLFKGAKIANVYMIPAWNVGGRAVADFTIVNCGSGTVSAAGASSHLWIDTPDTTQTRGGYWRGPVDSRITARSAWPDLRKPGTHTLAPGGLTAWLVSTGAQGPRLTLEYYPAWLGDAAS